MTRLTSSFVSALKKAAYGAAGVAVVTAAEALTRWHPHGVAGAVALAAATGLVAGLKRAITWTPRPR